MICPPVPPPPPAGDVTTIDAHTIGMPVGLARWYALRSAYADEVSACLMLETAATHRVTLGLTDETLRADHWRKVAKGRPGWGWVAGGAIVGAVGTGLLVWSLD